MSADPLHKPNRGDQFRPSASQWAYLVDGARKAHETPNAVSREPLGGLLAQQSIAALVKNTSGEILPAYSLVGIGEPFAMAELGGEVPSLAFGWVQPATDVAIGITLGEIGEDKLGRVLLMGTTWARVMHPCDGERVDAYGGNGHLVSSPGGRVIVLGKPSGADPDPPEVALMAVLLTQGAGSNCVNTWWLSDGATDPAGGTITFALTINGVTEDVEFSIPSTIAETITALETHSEIASGDVTIVGGTLPEVAQRITFKNNPTNIELASNSLTASWDAPPTLRWEPA